MLHIGTALVEITPEAGSIMGCFPRWPERTPRRAEGAHDPLRVRVLCMTDGKQTAAICACDVTTLQHLDITRVRTLVGEHVPALNGPNLIMAATHTHSGPDVSYRFGNTPDDPWVRETLMKIADAVVQAHAGMQPARLSVGCVDADLAHNRRVRKADGTMEMVHDFKEGVTTGITDPQVCVLRFMDEQGKPLAVLYNFAAHALTVGPKNTMYTADFPGVASGCIEAEFPGAMAFFVNGGAGNQHPRKSMREGFEVMCEFGETVGKVVFDAAGKTRDESVEEIRFASEVVSFPNRVDNSLQVDVEISCLRLGSVIMAFVPGEPFVEFQLGFKESVQPDIGVFVGFANGAVGYMPTLASYDEGGYGVDLCTFDPPDNCRTGLPPGAGERVLERLLALNAQTR